MSCYVGLDASKRTTKICVLDETGAILEEGVVDSDPKAIVAFLRGQGRRYARVGMEAWTLASWLYAGLARAGLPVIVIEALHAHGVLKATRRNKTDRNDAKGIAEMMRAGIYKSVHVKTPESQRIRALLTVRKLLRSKAVAIENGIRAVLLVFGQKLKAGLRATYERQARALIRANADLAGLVEPLLAVRRHINEEAHALEGRLKALAEADPVCRRLMTAPGVGPLNALTYRVAIDEPRRFSHSRAVGVHLGLTPRTNQSGEKDTKGGITKMGDSAARCALFLAATVQLRHSSKPWWLKVWGEQIAARRGRKKAIVAIARRLAVTLHKMWVTETDFRWTTETA